MKKKILDGKDKDIAYIKSLFIAIKSKYSFGRINFLKDLLLAIGHNKGEIEYAYPREQLDSKISIGDIKELEANYLLRKEMEWNEKEKRNIPTPIGHDYEGFIYSVESKGTGLDNKITTRIVKEIGESKETRRILTSPHQTAKLFKFQNDNAIKLLDGILIHKRRCQLLISAVGTGKTFMIYSVIRQLWDMDFFYKNGCISPWPVVYITRATIVEQTRRVGKNLFGLDMVTQCHIINIEQLRSLFGSKFMIDRQTVVEYGQEHEKFKWKDKLHPMLLIIDESQLAKNPDSTQSKIIYALSEIPSNIMIYIICMSATPFTRVSEAGYMCVNTWKEI